MTKMRKLKFFVFFPFFFSGFFAFSQYATNVKPKGFGSWECFGYSMLDVVLPGVGYALTDQYDKTVIMGGIRWGSRAISLQAQDDKNYLGSSKIKQIEKEDSTNDKQEIFYFYNQPDIDEEIGFRTEFNFAQISIYDFYTHGCKPNTTTYYNMAAPLNIFHYYDKWYFWAWIGLAAYGVSNSEDTREITYTLGQGLKKEDLKPLAYQHYFTGIAEESFFRGVVQSAFYDFYQNTGLSKTASRYLGIFSSALVFSTGHTGQGVQATGPASFLYAVAFGLMYQPDNNTFDLITPAAAHSWQDIIVINASIDNATIKEQEDPLQKSDVAIPLFLKF